MRRGLVELGGGAFGFLDMDLSVEVDGRGTYGDRLLPGAHDMKVGIPNAWISAEAGPALNLMVGVQPTPFSLEHRTDPDDLFALEPSLASQLAVPFGRAIGATVWGTSLHKEVGYDMMWIAGTGNTLPTSFAERGGAGRIFFRPYGLSSSTRWDRLQIGLSGRWTVRDGHSADLSRDDLTTGNGYALWSRRFVDSLGRTEAILPSGDQRALGVEVVSPTFRGFNFTGEAYVFDDNTREAVESLAATTTERLGSLQGAGWYGQLSYVVAPLFPGRRHWTPTHDVPYDRSQSLEAGLYPHPRRRDPVGVPSAIESLTELQFTLRAGRVDASYQPTRGSQTALYGVADAQSPGGRVDVWELGGTASLWWTRIFRLTAGWESYHAPGAGTPASRVTLPAQVAGTTGAPWMHELTLRARMAL
jgi:hypothetical protein